MRRLIVLFSLFCLVLPLMFLGCEGDTGPQGPAGPPGPPGSSTTDVVIAVAPESCAVCHDDQVARNGDSHQADYDQRFQDNVVVVSNIQYAFNGVDNTHTVTFNMTRNSTDFDCTETATDAPEDSLGIYFAEYDSAAGTFDPPTPLTSRLSLGNQNSPTLAYDGSTASGGTNTCSSTVAAGAEGDLSARNGIILVYGRDDRQGALPSPSRVQLAIHPFAGLLVMGTVDYVSPASTKGCERCHTRPFLKHGYIYGRVAGDPATDFYSCKACHADNGSGGHEIWQVLVDDPQLSGALYEQSVAAGTPGEDLEDYMTPAELALYAYRTRLMNDVHMSHAMEFAYPQSMANCATCHEGKLNMILTDANFTAETCKSCHPVVGGTDAPNADGDFAVDTINDPVQAPALAKIWADRGVDSFHTIGSTCNNCHSVAGGQTLFSQIHTGYDKVIYGDTIGTKYSEAIVVSIDNASFVDNNLTISFSASGSLGTTDSANIVPTVMVGLYGYDTKHFYIGPHERDADRNRLLEFAVDNVTVNPRFTVVTSTPGSWEVVADLSLWAGYIDNNTIRRAEIAVLADLDNADGVQVALNAPSRTFDLKANAFDDGFYPAVVKVADGCNTCHDALATTFHNPARGGNVVVCRMCHITKSPGSHLELQSRSIDSYVHAIHRFQVFDIGDIDFTDPVEELHFEHHVQSNFPRFGIEDCQSCHNPGVFNVPDQSKSMPGALSSADLVPTRNIGTVPSYIVGPATRACGACHRAEAIIANKGQGDANMLASINSHMKTNGYLVEVQDDAAAEVLAITDAIFSIL